MNKLFLLAILISSIGFAQQLEYRSGGRVFDSQNQKIKTDTVRKMMKDNQEALRLYTAGRRKKTWGNVLFYGGLTLCVANLYDGIYGDAFTADSHGAYVPNHTEPTLAIIGGAMIVASIPIKIGYPKKIKAAINAYNKDIAFREGERPDVTLLATSQGLGVKISF